MPPSRAASERPLQFYAAGSAASGEEGLEERRGFVGEDSKDNFDAVIQARVREDFETRPDCAATRVVSTANEFCDTGLDHGASTHRTWLKRDVHRGTGKTVVVENVGGFTEDNDFGVSGGIVVANGPISGLRDDFVFADEKSADGDFSGGSGGAGFVESELHEIEIGGHAKKE